MMLGPILQYTAADTGQKFASAKSRAVSSGGMLLSRTSRATKCWGFGIWGVA